MVNKGVTRIQRGQAITFRLPSDTPEHIMKQLQKLKETERRNFSSKIAEFALEGVVKSVSKGKETITIPLPKALSKEQRNWLKHSHSEALLGTIVYQLLADPVRAASIVTTLNSNSIDLHDALQQQERDLFPSEEEMQKNTELPVTMEHDIEHDLMNFDLKKARQELASSQEEVELQGREENAEDLLGDFLAKMNK